MASKEVTKWGDDAMYFSQKMRKEGERIVPQVYLLSATADPLGALAAGMRMYRGDPVYSLAEISDDERKWAWEESIKTHLKAPWEFIDFQFMIEGVTRAFTHQMVRQRTAVYAQESLRFAVKENLADEIPIPPSVIGNENAVAFWTQTVSRMQDAYESLLSLGIPAEDARGLLPHATTTRLIYKTNFRGLMEHAGNRLCTQAQFEWRSVFMGFMKAIHEYKPASQTFAQDVHVVERPDGSFGASHENYAEIKPSTQWQFELIATPRAETFAPVCYHLGKCPFMSELDRGCTIRDRVQDFSERGVPPSQWGQGLQIHHDVDDGAPWDEEVLPIDPMEWMANPRAGVTTEDNVRPD